MNLSLLNLVPVRTGETFKDAMDQMVNLAQAAEDLGYKRYWIAEHHNTPSIASSATALLIGKTLENTKSIRVGSGGVMLPNHSPYVVAEYYGTLETMYPGRVDLGLGRAPGTDRNTAMAIRRTGNLYSDFASEVAELQGYFEDTNPVSAYPAAGLNVPFYILGSSTDSAYLASEMGLPYVFAGHFAPQMVCEAVDIYRRNFKPSKYLEKPYVIVCLNVIAADTDEEANKLGTSHLKAMINIVTGQNRAGLEPPAENEQEVWDGLADKIISSVPHFGPVAFDKAELVADYKKVVNGMRALTLKGSPETLKQQYLNLKKHLPFDELMISAMIYDTKAQIHSMELFKAVVEEAEKESQ